MDRKTRLLCLIIGVVFIFLGILVQIFAPEVQGASQNDFTLNVIHDNYPVREMDRRVALQFDSEYQLRLKNGHDRKATAKVFVDGALVSQLGDFILSPGSTFDLERFLDSSLTTGKRFRFVSLDHPDVDDSSREENGTVKVEFRLEKKVEPIKIVPGCHPIVKNSDLWICDEDDRVWLHISDAKRNVLLGSNTAKFSAADNYSDSSMVVSNTTSSTLPGATIGGRESQQAFSYAHVDVEDEMTVLMLRIVGIAPRLSYLWPW